MNQIKVKELPVKYFVTDIYYQSGNVNFKDETIHCKCGALKVYRLGDFPTPDPKRTRCEICKHFGIVRTKQFGTKHIQLIAVNPKLSRTSHINGVMVPMLAINLFKQNGNEFQCSLSPKKISQEQFDIANNAKEQGKDFFVYEVSEVK